MKCNLVDCILMDEKYIEDVKNDDKLNYICGTYEVGRYAWILDDVEYITPIKAKGKLGLWKIFIAQYNYQKLQSKMENIASPKWRKLQRLF